MFIFRERNKCLFVLFGIVLEYFVYSKNNVYFGKSVNKSG